MRSVTVYGSSHVARLAEHIRRVSLPSSVSFFGRGGMKASRPDERLLMELEVTHPPVVILCIGGNDLADGDPFTVIFANIRTLVNRLTCTGRDVNILDVFPRLNPKSIPQADYRKERKKPRHRLSRNYKDKFLRIHLDEQHFLPDGVHQNPMGNDIAKDFVLHMSS